MDINTAIQEVLKQALIADGLARYEKFLNFSRAGNVRGMSGPYLRNTRNESFLTLPTVCLTQYEADFFLANIYDSVRTGS